MVDFCLLQTSVILFLTKLQLLYIAGQQRSLDLEVLLRWSTVQCVPQQVSVFSAAGVPASRFWAHIMPLDEEKQTCLLCLGTTFKELRSPRTCCVHD